MEQPHPLELRGRGREKVTNRFSITLHTKLTRESFVVNTRIIKLHSPSSRVVVVTLGLSVHPAELQANTEKEYSEKGRSPETLYSSSEGETLATPTPPCRMV